MPRKKTREIKIRHLKCFGAIWEELSGHPGLAGYEITEAVIRVQERVRPTINNVEAVIERIRFSHATRKYRYPAILGREMIGNQRALTDAVRTEQAQLVTAHHAKR